MRKELEQLLQETNEAIKSCKDSKEPLFDMVDLLKFKLEIIEELKDEFNGFTTAMLGGPNISKR